MTRSYTIWLFDIAMGNGPFIDGLPFLKMGGFSMAMLVITRWYQKTTAFFCFFQVESEAELMNMSLMFMDDRVASHDVFLGAFEARHQIGILLETHQGKHLVVLAPN